MLVELALNRPQLAALSLPRDYIDAGVTTTIAARPLHPQPHIREQARVERIELQEPLYERLELVPALAITQRCSAEPFNHGLEGHRHQGCANTRLGAGRPG